MHDTMHHGGHHLVGLGWALEHSHLLALQRRSNARLAHKSLYSHVKTPHFFCSASLLFFALSL